MITATTKTGFLIEDGMKMARVIGIIRAYATFVNDQHSRDLADSLDRLPARTYYEPIQLPLVEQVEVVEAVNQ